MRAWRTSTIYSETENRERIGMTPQTEPRLIEAFTLMWGSYPGPASLVHKSKTIVAVNRACGLGGRKPGMICSTWESPDRHRGCLANRTLKERIPLHKEVRNEVGVFRVYWLPIPDYPEYYVHFTTETVSCESREPNEAISPDKG